MPGTRSMEKARVTSQRAEGEESPRRPKGIQLHPELILPEGIPTPAAAGGRGHVCSFAPRRGRVLATSDSNCGVGSNLRCHGRCCMFFLFLDMLGFSRMCYMMFLNDGRAKIWMKRMNARHAARFIVYLSQRNWNSAFCWWLRRHGGVKA